MYETEDVFMLIETSEEAELTSSTERRQSESFVLAVLMFRAGLRPSVVLRECSVNVWFWNRNNML